MNTNTELLAKKHSGQSKIDPGQTVFGDLLKDAQRNYQKGNYQSSYELLNKAFSIRPINVKIFVIATLILLKLDKSELHIREKLKAMIENILECKDSIFLHRALMEICQHYNETKSTAFMLIDRLVEMKAYDQIIETIGMSLTGSRNIHLVKDLFEWCSINLPLEFKEGDRYVEFQILFPKIFKNEEKKVKKAKYAMKSQTRHETNKNLWDIVKLINKGIVLKKDTLIKWLEYAIVVKKETPAILIYSELIKKDKDAAVKFNDRISPLFVVYNARNPKRTFRFSSSGVWGLTVLDRPVNSMAQNLRKGY